MERGRDLDQVLHQYMTFVKPAFEEFCLPVRISYVYLIFSVYSINMIFKCIILQTKKFADVIIPRGADNAGIARKPSNYCVVHFISNYYIFMLFQLPLI